MAKPTGFLEYRRQDVAYRPVAERLKDYTEITVPHTDEDLVKQAARCMDCGIPFCHGSGCPLRNRIPEFNDLVYQGRWREACDNLHSTNNFPEFTGRVCPAPCEASCTLNINDDPVLIEHIEYQIVERGFREGWITPQIPTAKTGKRVAVVGSGPAGLAAAQQLARIGHEVVVFEKSDAVGGLLRYGIPDFKLAKNIIDRRLDQMRAEGVEFQTGVVVGEDISGRYLRKMFDVVCLAMGAGQPRDLNVPGRDLENVLFAMDFLTQQNQRVAGRPIAGPNSYTARDKIVVVIGGGDTGSDCVGTSNRQGAKEVHQFEILPEPPAGENPETPWPLWPRIRRASSSHQEGCQRRWSIRTKQLVGHGGIRVKELHAGKVDWVKDRRGNFKMQDVAGTDFVMKVDLVLLAMGFVHVVQGGLIESLGLELDQRGNVKVGRDFTTNEAGVFACGDAADGASLVVRAIDKGRRCAFHINRYLLA